MATTWRRCHIAATLPPHWLPQLPQDLSPVWPLLAEMRSCGSCGNQCGGNVAAMWRQCGGNVASSPCRRHVVVTSSPCRRHVVVTSSSCRRHVVVTSSPCRRHVVVTSSSCRRHVVVTSSSCRRHLPNVWSKKFGKNSLERPIKSLRNCRSRMSAFDIPNSSMHSTWFKICQLFLSPKMCLFTQLEGLDTCDTWSTVILSLQWNTEILEVWSWKLGNLEARLEGELGLNLEGLNWDDPWNVSEPAQSFGTGNTASVASPEHSVGEE